MTTPAFIPCRAHSTRFPGKNVALFQGQPLVWWAIRVAMDAKRCGLVDCVLVSGEHANQGRLWAIAADAGLDRPVFVRPTHLSDNQEATILDVLRWHLTRESDGLANVDAVCLVTPTSPLRQLHHLVATYRLLVDADVAMTVTPFRQDPRYALARDEGVIRRVSVEEAPRYFKHDGTALWTRRSFIMKYGFYDGRIAACVVPAEESCDIDWPIDLEWAEFLARRRSP